jgi:ADP-heptose:LPS heptosyltransferase
MMSLLALFNIDENYIPKPAVLHIPEASKEKFAYIGEKFKGKKKVGIVWSGSVTFAGNAHRAVSLDQFLALTELPDIQLFSLQKGPKEKELSEHAIAPLIENLAPKFDSFADTAAAIEQLDLIVMTDSSVAHLAATLGKPVINLLQYKPYWLYGLAGDSCAWYNSMRFIRQTQPGDWQPVFDELRLLLQSDKVNSFP